jgi:hypothetical protein
MNTVLNDIPFVPFPTQLLRSQHEQRMPQHRHLDQGMNLAYHGHAKTAPALQYKEGEKGDIRIHVPICDAPMCFVVREEQGG